MVAFLTTVADEKSVALVAHEPILSAVAGALTGKARHPALRKTERCASDARRAATAGALRWRIDGGTGRRERLRVGGRAAPLLRRPEALIR